MGGDDSQKLRPWRGATSSLGRSKPPAHSENQHSSGKRRASLPGTTQSAHRAHPNLLSATPKTAIT